MELRSLLEKNKLAILQKWLAAICDTYPAGTAGFISGSDDMFANPAGHTIAANAENILDGLIGGEDAASLSASIEPIMRIRAVQDFTRDQAVSFISSLKTVISGQLEPGIRRHGLRQEWEGLQARIDDLALLACGIHAEMKEKIRHIRITEIKKRETFLVKLTGSRTI